MQRLKNMLGDLSTTRGKLKLLIITSGLLILIGAVSAAAINTTSTPRFCSSCHEMQPEFVTWQESTHANQATCVQCHIEPGLSALVKHKASAMVQVWEHLTKTYPDPIVMPEDVPSENCERCHEPGEIKPAGELKVSHTKHVAAEISCVTCHRGVAHADIARRGLTTGTDFSQWTKEGAQKEFTWQNTLPAMKTCMQCHTERKVSNDCTTCHSDLSKLQKTPGNDIGAQHQAADWKKNHGKVAQQAFESCNSCHAGNTPAGQKISSVQEFAQGNQFCGSCHQKRPLDHTPDWMMAHKKKVAEKSREYCLVCHSTTKPEAGSGAVTTYCNTCHKDT